MKCFGLVGALAVFSLAGCATMPRPTIMPLSTDAPTVVEQGIEKSYVLGEVQEATVGSALVRVQEFVKTQERTGATLIPSEDWYVRIPPTFSKTFAKGQPIQALGFVSDGINRYTAAALPAGSDLLGRDAGHAVLIDAQGRLSRKYLMNGYLQQDVDVGPPTAVFVFETKDVKRVVASGQNYEIIYGGTSAGSIRMTYREFTPDNIARVAFFQELSYDAAVSTVRFRNLAMKILHANNETIRFVIESD